MASLTVETTFYQLTLACCPGCRALCTYELSNAEQQNIAACTFQTLP
jgi:hypothetical protein